MTPNLPEASALLGGRRIDSVAAMQQAARDLHAFGPGAVLVKGGHLPADAPGAIWGARMPMTSPACYPVFQRA